MGIELAIPVGAAFEKRLAELVWENCPELARQTAAGKMALALDVDHKVVQTVLMEEMMTSIRAWVDEQVPDIKQKVLATLDTNAIVEECSANFRSRVIKEVDNVNIANEAGKRLDRSIDTVLRDKLKSYFGGNNESFHKIIQSRIDHYLEQRLNVPETSAAIAEGMHRMVANSEG